MTSSTLDRPDPGCELTVLGGFDLIHDEPLAAAGAGARLLAFLALHGRSHPVSRAALAEQLWSDTDAARAAARLRSALWRLPRAQGRSLITCAGTTVQLADFVHVDLWRAEDDAALLAADRSPSSLGVRTFQTDLLPNWGEDWLILEREAFRQTRLHALEQISARLCAGGSFAAALQAALSAVACEPLRETAHRRVIEVHLAEGNPAEALRQYQTFRRLLSTDLGLAPTTAIRSLVAPLLGRPVERGERQPARATPTDATNPAARREVRR